MNFKKFLIKKKINCSEMQSDEDYISVKDLGNWAWDEISSVEKAFGSHSIKSFRNASVFGEIAIACLGEKEIRKRLKELE